MKKPGYFKLLSHHPIGNIFHSLEFGANEHNIYFVTPGECLHMHQLGAEKKTIKSFENFLCGNVNDDYGNITLLYTNIKFIWYKISHLAYKYGRFLV